MRSLRPSLRGLWAGLVLAAVVSPVAAQLLRLVGMTELPRDEGTGYRCGGLSGIDYDPVADRWLAVSDDKQLPVRYYDLDLSYDKSGITRVAITGVHQLAVPEGEAPDVEAIRIGRTGERLWYASEGDAGSGRQPFIAIVAREEGKPVGFPLPPGYRYEPSGLRGIRPNQAIEGFAFSGRGTIWTALEGPLFEDGPPADFERGALIRLTEQKCTGEVVRQLAYQLEPVPGTLAGGKRATNGVAEILVQTPGRLLVLERAGAEFSPGEWRFTARLYGADVSDGEELDPRPLAGRTILPVRKWLLYDFGSSGRRVDNLEGLAAGRRLPGGGDTLVLVSDDNFSPHQATQVWVLEISIPEPAIKPVTP